MIKHAVEMEHVSSSAITYMTQGIDVKYKNVIEYISSLFLSLLAYTFSYVLIFHDLVSVYFIFPSPIVVLFLLSTIIPSIL